MSSACGDDTDTNTAGGGSDAGGNGGEVSNGGAPTGGAPAGPGGAGGESTTTSDMGGMGGADPWAGPVESLGDYDLGTHNVNSARKLPIPDRALGFTILTEASGGIGVDILRPPSGSAVITDFAIPGTGVANFAGLDALAAANAQSDLPSALPVQAGDWLYIVAGDGVPTVRSRAWVRRTEDGAFHGGLIDIHVRIAGTAANQNYMNAVLVAMFEDYYGPLIGLGLGTVTFGSVDGSYEFINNHDEYRQLLAANTAGGSAPAVNLFVVGGFGGNLENALGVAGGVPGAPMVHGTVMSGVAYTPTGDVDYDASVLAHEIGHLGGLFHTTESQISAFDPLGDTPTCPTINQNPNSCPDVTNVMFPIAYGGYQLTSSQVTVLRGSALYRGILTEGGTPSPPILPTTVAPRPLPETSLTLPAPSEHAFDRANDSALSRLLHGHWCAHGGDVGASILPGLSERDLEELADLAWDEEVFDVARAHALTLLSRVASTREAALELARQVVTAQGGGRQMRLAAIEVIHRLDREALPSLRTSPAALQDSVVTARIDALAR